MDKSKSTTSVCCEAGDFAVLCRCTVWWTFHSAADFYRMVSHFLKTTATRLKNTMNTSVSQMTEFHAKLCCQPCSSCWYIFVTSSRPRMLTLHSPSAFLQFVDILPRHFYVPRGEHCASYFLAAGLILKNREKKAVKIVAYQYQI